MEAVKMKRSVRIRQQKEAQKALPITEAKAYLKYIRIAPRKIQYLLDLIRGENTAKAAAILRNTSKVSSEPLLKLLNSATANAENNYGMEASNLYISECFVCEGPTLKRIQPVSKGRAHRILKRTSHVTLVVKEREEQN